MDLASSVILATEIEVQEFQAKLDIYDEVTVKALMENQKALDAINAEIEEKFKDSHVMDDGRKVLKSKDGTWAIDEEGNRLDAKQTISMKYLKPELKQTMSSAILKNAMNCVLRDKKYTTIRINLIMPVNAQTLMTLPRKS